MPWVMLDSCWQILDTVLHEFIYWHSQHVTVPFEIPLALPKPDNFRGYTNTFMLQLEEEAYSPV